METIELHNSGPRRMRELWEDVVRYAASFALIGPAIGWVAVMLMLLVLPPWDQPNDLKEAGAWVMAALLLFVSAYWLGLLPALASGAAMGIAVGLTKSRRLLFPFASTVGALTSLGFCALGTSPQYLFQPVTFLLMGAGAVAAPACLVIMRRRERR